MTRNKYFAIICASAVSATALTSGLAFADSHDREDQAEVQLFLDAPHNLTAAIEAAESSAGGSAINASFDEDNGAGFYEIDVVAGDQTAEVTVDATSGEVTATNSEPSDSDDAVDLTQLGGDLAAVIATAETQSGGKVMSVEAEHSGGNLSGMEIEIANADGAKQDYFLNAADGKLAPATN